MPVKSLLNFLPSGRRSMRLRRQSRRANDSGWQIFETAFLTMALAGMGACQSTQQTPSYGTDLTANGGADFCQAARAIYYSRHDTPPTIAQIKEHNAVGVALKCGWATKAQIASAHVPGTAKGAK
jgi:hypothetical protein